MNSTARNIIFTIIGVLVGWWLLKFVVGLAFHLILEVVLPLALVAGIVYVGYIAFGRKALGGGRRYLP